MSKIIVTMWTTLDGFIADADGELGWISGDAEMSEYEIKMVGNADTLLLGRKTYQDFAGYWAKVPDNPKADKWEKIFADKINALKKIVFSKSLKKAEWNDSTIAKEIVPEEIEKLKKESKKGIVIYGSASIIQELTKHELVDEYQFLVHPIILEKGIPLFKDKVNLKLVKTEPFNSGVMLLTYQIAKNKPQEKK